MMRMPKRINIVLDALDECTDQSGLLAWLKIISTQHDMNIHIVATSRYEVELEIVLSEWPEQDLVSSAMESICGDIQAYV